MSDQQRDWLVVAALALVAALIVGGAIWWITGHLVLTFHAGETP